MLFRSGRWAQHVRETGLLVLSIALLVQAAIYALRPALLEPLYLVDPPTGGLVVLGALLLFGAMAFMVIAQLDLGASWRVGFDDGARPGLVTTGLYRFSRNPIYLALFAALAGMFVLIPTWLSLAMLVGTIIGIRNQVLEEERFLRRKYGDEFASYARRVGRFIPGLGTLSA
jgi:protein-S-isoprenylcysteine O-methyltransferase Ste14